MGMVENQEQTRRPLGERDHDEIRYLRFCGLTVAQVAAHMGVGYDAVRYRIRHYALDAPISKEDAVTIELRVSMRKTSGWLQAEDLTIGDHGRLCATQVKLASVLMRAAPRNLKLEEDNMTTKSVAARARLEAMDKEELRNEVRRLAGMEHKALAGDIDRDGERGGTQTPGAEPVLDECDGRPKAADSK